MNITDNEIEMLKSCQSEQEWNDVCDQIKRARNGQYPQDWWPKVKLSGLMDSILSRFGQNSEIKFSTF